jgi:hypothetical protein
MKHLEILLAVAAIGLAGCRAQEGAKQLEPGLPPQAIGDVVVVELNSAGNSIDALANDIDQSGTGLTITSVAVDQTLPAMAGAVATTDGDTVTFTPPATFVGVVTLDYSIEDGTGAVSAGTIAVSVLPVAPPPVALPDAATVMQDAPATDVDVLANDIDLASGGLDITGFTVTASLPAAAHTVVIASDQIRFTPAAGFVGVVVIDYAIEDSTGATAVGVLTVVVSPIAVPTGPVPVPDAEVVDQDAGATDFDVVANDIDPLGLGLTLTNVVVTTSVPSATHAVSIVGNQVRFTPAAAFVGSVIVTYTVEDDDGASADGVLTVVVSPLDLPVGPVAVPDTQTVAQGSGNMPIDVLANDVDFLGNGLFLTDAQVTAAAPTGFTHTVSILNDEVQFAPAAGFAGVVVIGYEVTDDDGNTAAGVLNVVVTPTALQVGLLAVPDAEDVPQDSVSSPLDVLDNDVDFTGLGLTIIDAAIIGSVPTGTHAVSHDGTQLFFTPDATFAGVVQLTYTAQDSNAVTSVGVVNVTVTPTALQVPPVALPDLDTASSSGGMQAYSVLLNDVDPAGGGLVLTNVSLAGVPALNAGAVAISPDLQQVEYTPVIGYAGVVTITYTAEDDNGNATTSTLSLVVAL